MTQLPQRSQALTSQACRPRTEVYLTSRGRPRYLAVGAQLYLTPVTSSLLGANPPAGVGRSASVSSAEILCSAQRTSCSCINWHLVPVAVVAYLDHHKQASNISRAPATHKLMDAPRPTAVNDLELPLLARILGCLTPSEAGQAACVHPLWHSTLSANDHLWQQHLFADFACTTPSLPDGDDAGYFRCVIVC